MNIGQLTKHYRIFPEKKVWKTEVISNKIINFYVASLWIEFESMCSPMVILVANILFLIYIEYEQNSTSSDSLHHYLMQQLLLNDQLDQLREVFRSAEVLIVGSL
jgi:hypothetical protein